MTLRLKVLQSSDVTVHWSDVTLSDVNLYNAVGPTVSESGHSLTVVTDSCSCLAPRLTAGYKSVLCLHSSPVPPTRDARQSRQASAGPASPR